jgi:hypothetical protein
VPCLLLCALLLAALPAAYGPAPTSPLPAQTGDGWQISAPAEVGLDGKKLDRAAAHIRDGTYKNVHSLRSIVRGSRRTAG